MKTVLDSSKYSFNKTAKTVDFSSFTDFDKSRLYAIINTTYDQTIIYAVGSDAQGLGGSFSGSVLTLDFNTSNMSNTDSLQVIYDDQNFVQKVSATSLPLPSGAATSAKQPALGTAGSASSDVITVQGIASMTALKVDGSAVTQPVSATSLPLPTGAATSAKQDTGNTSLSNIDGKLTSLGQKAMSGSVPVVISSDQSTIPVSGTITTSEASVGSSGSAIPSSSTLVGGSDGTNLRPVKTSSAGNLQVDVTSSALPTGASTSANQTNGSQKTQIVDSSGDIAEVKSLSSAIASTDKGLVGASLCYGESSSSAGTYVPIKVNPSGALVTDTTVGGTIAATQSGTWNINNVSGTVSLPTGAATSNNQITANTSLASIDGKLTSVTVGTIPAIPAGTNTIGKVDVNGTVPISAVSLPLPTGAASAAKQPALGVAGTASSDVITVQGIASMTALKVDGSASTQPVSQSGTWNINNVSGTVSLPTGASTEATLSGMSGKLPATLGQKTMVNSMSVSIASDQSTFTVREASNTNGSNTDSTVSTVATLTAPANSVGFILMNLDTSTANIRWRIGSAATSSAGQQLQPGRDTGYIPCAANISICAESGTQNYNVQWILSS